MAQFNPRAGRFALLCAVMVLALTEISVATADAQVCANQAFRTGPSTHLPDCRAYELVSEEKGSAINVSPADQIASGSQVAPDGSAILYGLSGALPGAAGSSVISPVVARRLSDRWGMTSLVPPHGPGQSTFESLERVTVVSQDLSRWVAWSNLPLTGDAWVGGNGVYPFFRVGADTPTPRLLTPSLGGAEYVANVLGGSRDLTQLLIETEAVLTESALSLPTGPKVYKWDDGTLSLVTVLPDGTPTRGSAAGATSSAVATGAISDRIAGAMSSDGEVAFFTASPSGNPSTATGRVYRRENDATVMVNAAENPSADPPVAPGAATYRLASRDGKRVLFSSTQALVEGDVSASTPASAATDLYMYTHSESPDTDENLTLLSRPVDAGGAVGVQGVLGASDDGARVYFVATGRLTSDAPADTSAKAYLWQDGDVSGTGSAELRYLGSVAGTVTTAWGQAASAYHLRSVSADGRALMLVTSAQLDPDRPNGGLAQVYRYGIAEERFTCVSCPAASAPTAAARIRHWDGVTVPATVHASGVEPRWGLSDNGETALFESVDPLVSGDINGRRDVYMWKGGARHLVSTGRSGFESLAVEVSASGNDVFFTTTDALVGRDVDDSRDMYTARLGGGLPDPVKPTPGCVGDACQGPGRISPLVVGTGSEALRESRNVTPSIRKSVGILPVSARQRRAAARSGVLRLRVRSNRSGAVRVTAHGRIGGRARRIGATTVRLSRPGRAVVRLRLSAGAKASLRAGGRLRVRVAISAQGAATRTLRVVLRGAAR